MRQTKTKPEKKLGQTEIEIETKTGKGRTRREEVAE